MKTLKLTLFALVVSIGINNCKATANDLSSLEGKVVRTEGRMLKVVKETKQGLLMKNEKGEVFFFQYECKELVKL